MKTIIVDTDLDTDCDDMGALAVLHELSRQRRCKIAGVICDVPVPMTAACAHCVNEFYGCGDIPVGLVTQNPSQPRYGDYFRHRQRCSQAGLLYVDAVVSRFGRRAVNRLVWDGVELYRKLLSESADGSVTVCAIGLLTVLAQVLASAPDRWSALPGLELFRRKVREVVCMAGAVFPEGMDRFNWRMDPVSASLFIRACPVPLVVSPSGVEFPSGSQLMSGPSHSPVALAFQTFLHPGDVRPSYDQLAMLYAIGGVEEGFQLQSGYRVAYDAETYRHEWRADAESQHHLLLVKRSVTDMVSRIDELMGQ